MLEEHIFFLFFLFSADKTFLWFDSNFTHLSRPKSAFDIWRDYRVYLAISPANSDVGRLESICALPPKTRTLSVVRSLPGQSSEKSHPTWNSLRFCNPLVSFSTETVEKNKRRDRIWQYQGFVKDNSRTGTEVDRYNLIRISKWGANRYFKIRADAENSKPIQRSK